MGQLKKKLKKILNVLDVRSARKELDALYRILYEITHDLEDSPDLSFAMTRDRFAEQWRKHEKGEYLLSDPWFAENVTRIISEEELQLKPEWFKGKKVLDAGCGNGRWTYGLLKLGAKVTAVDINESAVEKAKEAVGTLEGDVRFIISPLEDLSEALAPEDKFDLVWCWGVLHHAKSFVRSFREIARRASADGLVYLYLYGRESVSLEEDIALFRERVLYNLLPTEEEKYAFLLEKAGGDENKVHNMHDVYAPFVNRRFEFEDVRKFLVEEGFEDVVRTIDHTELFVRALRESAQPVFEEWLLPRKEPPYWFTHHVKK